MTHPRNVTLKDVADLAGVSLSTASRVLSGQETVKRELALLVRDASDQLGYRPNIAARSLRLAQSMTLGAVFNRLDSPLTRTLLTGLEVGTREQDYALLLTNANGDPAVFRTLMERLLERQVDALLVYRPPSEIDDCLRLYEAAGTPVISVFAKPRGVKLPLVTNRPTEAIRRAVDHLASLGHRAIGYVATDAEIGDFRSQLLEASAARNGMRLEVLQIEELADTDAVRAMTTLVRGIAARDDRPTALFARYRHIPGLVIAAREQRWQVPRDLSLVSFGDGAWLSAHDPPIAAIGTDGIEIGRAAALTAIDAIAQRPIERVQELAGSVWEARESAGRAPSHGGIFGLRKVLS